MIGELGSIKPRGSEVRSAQTTQNTGAGGNFAQVLSEIFDATPQLPNMHGPSDSARMNAIAELVGTSAGAPTATPVGTPTVTPAVTPAVTPTGTYTGAPTGMPAGMSGAVNIPDISGMINIPGSVGISNMPFIPGMTGMPGMNGADPLMQGLMTPGLYEMQNGMLAVANQGEMSGEHLIVFMMMMMMQSAGSGGGMSDMGPIMQMLASMLTNLTEQPSNNATPAELVNNAMMMPILGGNDMGVRGMVQAALSKVGYHERNRDGSIGSGNFTKFGAWFGMDGQPWCAMFVSWAADQAGILDSVVPGHAWTPSGVAAYRERGLFEDSGNGYLPREGDAIYFFNPAQGRVAHVGIVVAFDPVTQRVYTVEGNTNNQVAIRHYDLNNPRIHGFGRNGGISFGIPPHNSTTGVGVPTT